MDSDNKDTRGGSPGEERAEIGTPAGEEASKGRQRHGTECLTGECGSDEVHSRRVIQDDEEIADEDFALDGQEISTTGGITGTRVKGGRTPGGTTEGGTPGTPQPPGKPAEGER